MNKIKKYIQQNKKMSKNEDEKILTINIKKANIKIYSQDFIKRW